MASIPGLELLEKDGWEIVGFDNVSQDEWFVDSEGRIVKWSFLGRSIEKKIIVRKVQHPKPAKQCVASGPVSLGPETIQAIAKAVAVELRLNPQQVSRTSRKLRPLLEPYKHTPPASDYRLLGPAKDEPRIVNDYYWSLRNKTWVRINAEIVEYANRDNWAACRQIEEPKQPWTPKVGDWVKVTKPLDCAPAHKIWWVKDMDRFDGQVMQVTSINPQSPWAILNENPYEFDFAWLSPAERPKDFIEQFMEAIQSPTQQAEPPKHREPTLSDLKNGPIECEVRNSDNEKDDWASRVLVFVSAYHSCKFVTVDPADRDRICTWNQCRIEDK